MVPNVETKAKLQQLKTFLREEPRRFAMDYWGISVKDLAVADKHAAERTFVYSEQDMRVTADDFELIAKQRPPCGTVACLAGSIAIFAGLVKPHFADGYDVYTLTNNDARNAATWLGLDWMEAKNLFYFKSMTADETGWPENFRAAYKKAETPEEKVEVACSRIDHYSETGQ